LQAGLSDLARLRNFGPTTANWLAEIGVVTAEDLDSLGAVEAYRRLKASRPAEATVVALYTLEASWLDVPWTDLPLPERKRLRQAADGAWQSVRQAPGVGGCDSGGP